MTLSKPKWKTLLLSSPLLVLLLGSTLLLVNNFGCNYEMTIQSQGVDYRGVCRWGRFSFIEEELSTKVKWRLSGWQLNVGDQLTYLVTKRELLAAGNGNKSPLTNYHQIQSEFALVNYAWLPLTENKIVIFQRTPHHDVIVANREGWLDLYRWFFPPKPLLAAQQSAAGSQ